MAAEMNQLRVIFVEYLSHQKSLIEETLAKMEDSGVAMGVFTTTGSKPNTVDVTTSMDKVYTPYAFRSTRHVATTSDPKTEVVVAQSSTVDEVDNGEYEKNEEENDHSLLISRSDRRSIPGIRRRLSSKRINFLSDNLRMIRPK